MIVYKKYDIVSVVPFLHGGPTVFVSSRELMNDVVGHGSSFDKASLNVFDKYVDLIYRSLMAS